MIPFWRQLRFLLWKGVVVKRRQKAWLAIEILVPILLFAILALIRTRDFNEYHTTCHYASKGFASAGLAPFLNGWLCFVTNRCSLSPVTGDEQRKLGEGVERSLLVDGLRAFSDQLAIIGEDPQGFNKSMASLAQVIHLLATKNLSDQAEPQILFKDLFKPSVNVSGELKTLGLNDKMADAVANAAVTRAFFENGFNESARYANVDYGFGSIFGMILDTVELFCKPEKFDASFVLPPSTALPLTAEDRKGLCSVYVTDIGTSPLASGVDASQALDKIFPSLGADLWSHVDFVKKFGNGPFGKFLKDLTSFKDTNSLITAITCGQAINPKTMEASMKGNKDSVRTVFDTLRDYILDYVMKVTPGKAKSSNDTDCYGIPIREVNCSFSGNVLLQQVLPMLQGRILVAPAGPLVDRLVEKLNDPLRYADFFTTLFPQYAEIATELQDAINLSDLPKAATNVLAHLRRSELVPNTTLDRVDEILRTVFAPSSDPASLGAMMKGAAESATDALRCMLVDRIVPVANESAMEATAMCLQRRQQYFSGIILSGITNTTTAVPTVVTYSIRHQASMVDGTTSVADAAGNIRSRDTPFVDLKYTTFGFVYLQEAVEKALRELIAADGMGQAVDDIGAYSQQEPYPCYFRDTFNVSMFLGLFVVLSWMVPTALLVKNIVYEKEQRLKELMRIMGLGDSIHFLSWALISLALNTLSVIVISSLLKWGELMPAADISLLFLFLILFALATIAQALLLSTFFSNANIATACTAVVVFLCFYPYQLSNQARSPTLVKISLLFPQTAMGFGMTMIASGDEEGNAVWATVNQLRIEAYHLSLLEVMVALAVDTIIFCLAAWYISAVHPGVHGVSQPWYFFCQPSYWFSRDDGEDNDNFVGVVQTPQSDRVERDPVDQKLTVAIRGLEKIYSNGMKALDGLDLRLYEGQITGLLGHNGAGKTTTMSMLCGLFSPSGGTATVYGRDLRKEMRAVRDTLGVCPQHNVLFDVLTVREQLYFYAALKGVADENLDNEVTEVIESTGLGEKTECRSGSLSGGQKRRLCIGIALIGGSRFVILDEPTAGVDVNSRKSIWKLLMKHKKERTILLSTHHMDEADMLSDRIAILSEGKLSALGSSVFLKNRFGRHTTLTCVKKDRRLNYAQAVDEICTLYEKLPVTLGDETEEELTFHLPISSDSQVLEEFFRLFDERLCVWNLTEYGISAPTLQDIFVSLAPQSDLKLTKVEENGCMGKVLSCLKGGKTSIAASEQQTELVTAKTDGSETPDVCETATPLKQGPRKSRHARALLAARAHYTRRSLLTLFFEMIAPIMLLLLCELYAKYVNKIDERGPKMKTQPPMFLMPSLYGNGSNHYLSLWDQSPDGVGAQLAGTLLDFPGMGTRCVPNGPQWERSTDPTCSYLLKDGVHRFEDACWMPLAPSNALQDQMGKESQTYRISTKNKALPPICCSNDTRYPCLDTVDDRGTLNLTSLLADKQSETNYTIEQTCGSTVDMSWNCTQLDWTEELVYQHAHTSDFLFDLSFRNLSQFRLITQYATGAGQLTNKTYTFTGGLSLGHVNPAAPSANSTQQRKSGWRVMRDVLRSQAGVIGIDLSSLPSPNTTQANFTRGITIDSFMDRVLGAMETKESVKLWFNNKRWASLPIYTNILSNAMLRLAHLRKGGTLSSFKQGIVGVNHPMNSTLEDSFDQNAISKVTLFRVVLLVLVLSVIPAGFAVFLVEERVNHSFHLQLVAGLERKMYWSMSYLFDMSLYLLSICIIIGIYLILGVKDFTYTPGLVGSFLLLWILYGLVDVILVYILQRSFNIAALAFVMISIGTFFVGIVTTMTVMVLEQLMKTDSTLITTHSICYYVFLIIPQYNLGMAISRGAMAYQSVAFGESYFRQINRADLVGSIPMPSILQKDLMGIHIAALTVQALVGLLILVFLEHGSLGFLRRLERKKTDGLMLVGEKEEEVVTEDVDVSAESMRVAGIETSSDEYGLVVKELAKAFSDKLTVRGVSFAVERGECFGLLGLNGAGKTTTFGMMTGKLDIGHGEVRILGERVSSRSSDGFRNLGYCPQFDALNMKLTTKENVEFYARIRGIDERSMKGIVHTLLRSLHLLPYADVLTSALSGGNRRKLSVAVALVSQPPVIMLDEPSAGMDPGSQQFLWSVIRKMRRAGRAVVLTSHSMEECEALCTRIAILDKGKIRCIGSKQHLKNKFGEGFSLTVKFATTSQAEESQEFICERLPKAKLIAVHCSAAFYRIPSDLSTVVQILQVVNKVKDHFAVEDFSLSQTTLDEIFQFLSETRGRMFGLSEDFDVAEEEETMKGRQLRNLAIVFIIAVILLIILYELIMPVYNTPHYPFYNHIPNYTFIAPSRPILPRAVANKST